jgi:hypothetical protein
MVLLFGCLQAAASFPDFEEKACMVKGRLRIPCGNGYVTLPAMPGIG